MAEENLLGKCRVTTPSQRKKDLFNFLKQYGDDLPDESIRSMLKDVKTWTIYCDKKGEIASVGHYEEMDWYQCNLKGFATREDMRGKGLGNKITQEVVDKASRHASKYGPRCLVLGADIRYDNEPSIRMFKKAGFELGSEFCWQKGEKPASELQFVRFKPQNHSCNKP